MVKTAIVTGASSGIGLAICQKLCERGYEVYGIGRDFEKTECKRLLETPYFHVLQCDLMDSYKICEMFQKLQKEKEIHLLINNAGVGYYGLHEELNVKKIQEMVRVNLEAPMIITWQLLRMLKKQKGTIINISSVTASQSNPHGCAYGATKAGLSGFSRSLLDETRKYGVKVVQIQPDMTATNLYRNADFTVAEEEEAYLDPQEIAEAVEWILQQRDGVMVSDLTIKPQLHKIKRKKH